MKVTISDMTSIRSRTNLENARIAQALAEANGRVNTILDLILEENYEEDETEKRYAEYRRKEQIASYRDVAKMIAREMEKLANDLENA